MNTVVLFTKTFGRYKKEKCPDKADVTCIYKKFDGQDYFDNYILNTKGQYDLRFLNCVQPLSRMENFVWEKQYYST